jgi:hypothetical protein
MIAVSCMVICALMLLGVFPASWMIPAYQVTRFSDGDSEKTINFMSEFPSGLVYISIPRATNLSAGELTVSAQASVVSAFQSQSDFSAGSVENLSYQNGLHLIPVDKWWNASWSYRVPISVGASTKTRSNITVSTEQNISSYFATLGLSGRTLDEKSLRIVEYDALGNSKVFNSSLAGPERFEVPMEWAPAADYNASGNANVIITWLMDGATPANANRNYFLYFDDTSVDSKPAGKARISYWNDVLFSNWAPYPNFGLLYKNNNGNFSRTPSVSFPTNASAAVLTGDFNGDGYKDIVFANWYNGSSYSIDSLVFAGGPDGMDSTPDWYLPTNGTFGCGVGDVNSDGIDDVIFPSLRSGSNYTVGSRLYYGSTAGPSNATFMVFYTEGATDAAVADFNKDGKNDIIFANANNGTSGNVNSFIYLNQGSGFGSTPDYRLPSQNAYAVEVADLNKDGWQDVVLGNRRNTSISGPSQYEIESYIYYGSQTGFNSTPDVRLPTHGALDAKIADLNQDGWLDIIFANYNDGATSNTMSHAYFGGPSGFSTTPGAYFNTSWAYGVDIGDVNDDGYLDVAFANYYDGIATDIDSSIFLGPCYALQQPDIFLPTHGADDVHIADVDRYYMSSDKNPLIITPGDPEGHYVSVGTYNSPIIQIDEKVLSASVTWNASIPTQPAGCNVNVYLSNNAGSDWTKVDSNQQLNFTTEGKVLKYKVELVSDAHNVETPIFQDITIIYEKESFPYNLTLDVNDDGHDEWSYPGKFNTTATLNESTMGLATILMGIVPRTGTGNFTVPLKFTSDRPGILRVYGLNITGNYRPEVIQALPEITMIENVPRLNVFNVTNYFRHLDEDKLVYTTIGNWNIMVNISENGSVDLTPRTGWYGEERFTLRATDSFGEYADLPVEVDVTHVIQAPTFTSALPGINVTEGDTVRIAFNLFDFVADPDTPKTALIFSVADITNNNISVDMDINQNVNVYSKAGWYGNATVKMKVSDGELSAYASFGVSVEHKAQPPPANQPPTMSLLPPLQLMESTQMDHAFNLFNFTSDPDTPLSNITFRIEENTNPKAGVTIGADGWVNIRPEKKWSGISFIMVNASDGEYGAKSSFTVTVTAKPVTAVTENNGTVLMAVYGLIGLVLILLVVFAMDIMIRTRKKKPGHPQVPAGAGAEKERIEPKPPEKGGGVPPIPAHGETASGPAPGAPSEVGPSPDRAAYVPVELAAETQPGEIGVAQPAPTVAVMEQKGGEGEPVGHEEPSVSAPDMTPPPEWVPQEGEGTTGRVAPGLQDGQAAPEASETPPATIEPEPPAEQAPPEEAAQKPSGKSAASLLAELHRAKTTADAIEGQETAQAPPSAPEQTPSPEAPVAPQPAVRAPATEIEAQDAVAEPEPATGPAGTGEGPAAEGDASQGPEGGQPAAEGQAPQRPVTQVRCASCKTAIPIYSAQRPLVVTCPQCGRMGMLK